MKKTKYLSTGILVSSLLFSTQTVSAESIDELNNQKNVLEKSTEDILIQNDVLKNEIDSISQNITLEVQALYTIESEIADLVSSINTLNKKINILESDISQKENSLIEQHSLLEEKKALLEEHLINMYTGGGRLSILELVLRANDLSELLNRFETYKIVSNKSLELSQEIETVIQTIEAQKKDLISNKEELEKSASQLAEKQTISEQKLAEKEKLLSQLDTEKNHKELTLNEQEQALNSISAQIIAMETEIQSKIAEAEAKAKAKAEAVAKAQTGSDSLKTNLHSFGTIGLPLAKGSYYISSNYGYRTDPVYGDKRLHSGTDFAAPHGTPIYAVESGYVLYSGAASGYGHWIVIRHDNGLYSIYGHMYANQLFVSPGERVERGQHIAAVGSDGKSTGAHLHLCIATSYIDGKFSYVDPMTYY